MNPSLSAVVVAAGGSSRFQKGARSKQLIEWGGKPLFIHTLEALARLRLSEICLVVRASEEAQIHSHLRECSFEVPISVIFGGSRRQDSVRNGLNTLKGCDRVLIHDGARPFLVAEFLARLELQSKRYDALIPVLPIFETLKEIGTTGQVVRTHDRGRFVRVQTPQFFKFSLIKDAHEQLKNSTQEFTDDAAMLEHLGHPVQTCEGDMANIKVTVIEDLRSKNIHV